MLTFNEYIAHRRATGQPINGDREAFHDYIYMHGLGQHVCTVADWNMWWDRFMQWQDACDQAETLADALR